MTILDIRTLCCHALVFNSILYCRTLWSDGLYVAWQDHILPIDYEWYEGFYSGRHNQGSQRIGAVKRSKLCLRSHTPVDRTSYCGHVSTMWRKALYLIPLGYRHKYWKKSIERKPEFDFFFRCWISSVGFWQNDSPVPYDVYSCSGAPILGKKVHSLHLPTVLPIAGPWWACSISTCRSIPARPSTVINQVEKVRFRHKVFPMLSFLSSCSTGLYTRVSRGRTSLFQLGGPFKRAPGWKPLVPELAL